MNRKKLQVSDSFEEEFKFTQQEVELFIKLTGDNNPIHFDESYASETVFGKPIIHGLLSSSIFSKIIGMHLPGKGSIYLSQELNFLKPMFVNHRYMAKVEVSKMKVEKKIAYLNTTIYDKENSEITIKGYSIVKYKL